LLIDLFSLFKNISAHAGMPLVRCQKVQATMPVLEIVPMNKGQQPCPCSGKIGELSRRIAGTIFTGSEGGLGIGIIVADPGDDFWMVLSPGHASIRPGRPRIEQGTKDNAPILGALSTQVFVGK
jgi:hypothetical protein